jgi:hypothetical protein
MNDDAMSRFPVPDCEDLPEDLRERIDAETERAGFTPNVFAALAYAPDQFRAFVDYHDALVEDEPGPRGGGDDRRRRLRRQPLLLL